MSLTILTKPIPENKKVPLTNFFHHLKTILRAVFYIKLHFNSLFIFSGHHAVTRSLISGLKLCKFKFNFNPNSVKNLYYNVLVLSDIDALRQMILLKEKGVLNQLIAGPNVVTLAEDENSLIANPAIDKIIVPSDWVKENYLGNHKISRNKIYTWPAGVNTNFWFPKNTSKRYIVLIYIKNKSFDVMPLLRILIALSFPYKVLIYGNYSEKYYRKILNKSLFMVYIGGSESQGIALLESWAMNVPTFIFLDKFTIIKGIKFYKFSSSPYLTNDTGNFWRSLPELESLISAFRHQKYQPRDYVLRNMTDNICASNFINILQT